MIIPAKDTSHSRHHSRPTHSKYHKAQREEKKSSDHENVMVNPLQKRAMLPHEGLPTSRAIALEKGEVIQPAGEEDDAAMIEQVLQKEPPWKSHVV